MKLGFILKITSEGEREAFSINNKNEVWARYATDARSAIKDLSNFDGTERSVYLIKFLGTNGYLISVIKARPEGSGRPNDNTAAWIHFPANISISSEETIRVLKSVEEAISEEKGTNKSHLNELFEKEYEPNDVQSSAVETINSNEASVYAYRYFNGDYTLSELLGPSIAQQEYGKYKGVILINKAQGLGCNSSHELNFEPKKLCRFSPISSIDGFRPCFYSQNQYVAFDKTIEVPAGTAVNIYWYKKGYAMIKKSFVAQEDSRCIASAQINQSDYKIIIPRKLFFVTDSDGVPVNSYDIRINNQLMDGDSIEVSEASYLQQGINITISAKGFSDWRKYNVRPQLDRQVTVPLPKRVFHYEFAIPVYDGDKNTNNDAIAIVESHKKLKSSPFKGYVAYDGVQDGDGHINRLYLDDRWLSKLKYMAYGFASCILILLLYAGCSALENYEFQLAWPPLKEIKQHQPNAGITDSVEEIESQQESNLSGVINYLETNNVWHKDSLNTYHETNGLFDELNDFQYEAVRKRCDENQLSSSNLARIVSALEENKNNGYNPHVGKEKSQGKYNSDSDKEISIDNYIVWLSMRHEPDVAKPVNNEPKTPTKPHNSNITGKPVSPVKATKTNTTEESKKSRGGL